MIPEDFQEILILDEEKPAPFYKRTIIIRSKWAFLIPFILVFLLLALIIWMSIKML